MRIGFSTGSLTFGDFRGGLSMIAAAGVDAIELSALREEELDPLVDALDSLEQELDSFDYVSFHAPSARKRMSEPEMIRRLSKVAAREWSIIVHPDVIDDFSLWRSLGSAVCLENMDKRKNTGRTAAQFEIFFEKLPAATLCFDIGHAMQVDPTMQEAEKFLCCFENRLRQVHISYVNSQSHHERLTFEAIEAFRCVANRINKNIPMILETPVSASEMEDEVRMAKSIWSSERIVCV